MLNNKGFDLWAKGYDKSVGISEELNIYPFAGYKKLLNYIYNVIKQQENATILDIGFGTATLTNKLYQDNYKIFGIDFSKEMINIAKQKMPDANLFCYDFKNGVPKEIENKKFDFIISTYAIHHLTNSEKVKYLNQLYNMLSKKGKILIGDVAFLTKEEYNLCKNQYIENWDNNEIYIIFEDIKTELDKFNIYFEKISFCSGILILNK